VRYKRPGPRPCGLLPSSPHSLSSVVFVASPAFAPPFSRPQLAQSPPTIQWLQHAALSPPCPRTARVQPTLRADQAGSANSAEQDRRPSDYYDILSLLQPFEVYCQILVHFAALGIQRPLHAALADYRDRLYETDHTPGIAYGTAALPSTPNGGHWEFRILHPYRF